MDISRRSQEAARFAENLMERIKEKAFVMKMVNAEIQPKAVFIKDIETTIKEILQDGKREERD